MNDNLEKTARKDLFIIAKKLGVRPGAYKNMRSLVDAIRKKRNKK